MDDHDEFTKGYLQALSDLRVHVQERHDELRAFRWDPMGPFANALENYISQMRSDFDMKAIKMLGERSKGGQSK